MTAIARRNRTNSPRVGAWSQFRSLGNLRVLALPILAPSSSWKRCGPSWKQLGEVEQFGPLLSGQFIKSFGFSESQSGNCVGTEASVAVTVGDEEGPADDEDAEQTDSAPRATTG